MLVAACSLLDCKNPQTVHEILALSPRLLERPGQAQEHDVGDKRKRHEHHLSWSSWEFWHFGINRSWKATSNYNKVSRDA